MSEMNAANKNLITTTSAVSRGRFELPPRPERPLSEADKAAAAQQATESFANSTAARIDGPPVEDPNSHPRAIYEATEAHGRITEREAFVIEGALYVNVRQIAGGNSILPPGQVTESDWFRIGPFELTDAVGGKAPCTATNATVFADGFERQGRALLDTIGSSRRP